MLDALKLISHLLHQLTTDWRQFLSSAKIVLLETIRITIKTRVNTCVFILDNVHRKITLGRSPMKIRDKRFVRIPIRTPQNI